MQGRGAVWRLALGLMLGACGGAQAVSLDAGAGAAAVLVALGWFDHVHMVGRYERATSGRVRYGWSGAAMAERLVPRLEEALR